MLQFGTKAETLARLEGCLRSARVLPQWSFTLADWEAAGRRLPAPGPGPDPAPAWLAGTLVVRSSACAEDTAGGSLAGHFRTVPGVQGAEALERAVARVFASFGGEDRLDQVLIQPQLDDIVVSGVAFTRDPSTGGYYYVVNYDTASGDSGSVTAGRSNQLETFYRDKYADEPFPAALDGLLPLLRELEGLFGQQAIDIEFARTTDGRLTVLQARPLLGQAASLSPSAHRRVLAQVGDRYRALSRSHPQLLGDRALFGVMPDWNPAEIIGTRPRPLALSLYKELVTDSIWAYQRHNYGYRNLRSFPLLVSFAGLPYIDVRVSFNSFVPADIDEPLAARLVNFYLEQLLSTPAHHDKVEFEILLSCYTLDIDQRGRALLEQGFSSAEFDHIKDSLRQLTRRIINTDQGLWVRDLAKIDQLPLRRQALAGSGLDPIARVYWLIEDAKRYGTLPFAGLARAGFIAVQLLQSFVRVGVFTPEDHHRFMRSLQTVSSAMVRDRRELCRDDFLQRYGHLRPGTYDILSPRYDEAVDRYFDWPDPDLAPSPATERDAGQVGFVLSSGQRTRLQRLLDRHGLEQDALGLLNFIKGAIEGRERAKFVFTHSLSEVLQLLVGWGGARGFSREALSFVDIGAVKQLYASSLDVAEVLRRSVLQGRQQYRETSQISLPPLISDARDMHAFSYPPNTPNYITLARHSGPVVVVDESDSDRLNGAVLLIRHADPGYDWIFARGIGAFITMYGGANSHMAIRAAELGIPAVIGAGESLFRQWLVAQRLDVDCANHQVRVLT